jgi:putative FmdB family regulatory protein
MPLYDYACQKCGHQSELLVGASSQPACPECGSERMSKLLPVVAAPNRGSAASEGRNPPGGSCGAGCGCHPRG